MRLSPFHRELAKRVAEGKRNKEILAEFGLSASRLSVLKSNPLFRAAVKQYWEQRESAYKRGMDRAGQNVQVVIDQMLKIIQNPLSPAKVRLDGCVELLDRIGQSEGQMVGSNGSGNKKQGPDDGSTMVFEQILRATKTVSESNQVKADEEVDYVAALEDLEKDLVDIKKLPDKDSSLDKNPSPKSLHKVNSSSSKGASL